MWVTHYKPQPITASSLAQTASSKPKTGMLASLGSAAAFRGGDRSSNPLHMWLNGGLVLNGNDPFNPITWWIQQKRAGNMHGGLVHMALDVLGCPGWFNLLIQID
ncbi:hypothetical protein PTTG_06478 [Puccinia triticina 1-1 BBBD Race 1]|uniref:Uncharacterized protein n=1 Tax=Puccinia triticina (isolate 1-1 / race 1 (BBBD)) TaxID=630390 RepID=A0A0C4F062_PUCT1|nr:hypothetical protein PTTG_06478 [Puccinia triticina 1-1 BBBD Race 1]